MSMKHACGFSLVGGLGGGAASAPPHRSLLNMLAGGEAITVEP